ncbi:hypothetical protein [Streptomyces sp. NPDC059092]|uniref:hypothetical protein n=1 Tax=Streptomyces sp. NPDC059092 TaxID=3346725 RepID=UPI003693EB94
MAEEAEKALTADGYLHNGKWNAAVGEAANRFAGQVDLVAVVARSTGLEVDQPHNGVYIAYLEERQFLDFHVDEFGFGEANGLPCLTGRSAGEAPRPGGHRWGWDAAHRDHARLLLRRAVTEAPCEDGAPHADVPGLIAEARRLGHTKTSYGFTTAAATWAVGYLLRETRYEQILTGLTEYGRGRSGAVVQCAPRCSRACVGDGRGVRAPVAVPCEDLEAAWALVRRCFGRAPGAVSRRLGELRAVADSVVLPAARRRCAELSGRER